MTLRFGPLSSILKAIEYLFLLLKCETMGVLSFQLDFIKLYTKFTRVCVI